MTRVLRPERCSPGSKIPTLLNHHLSSTIAAAEIATGYTSAIKFSKSKGSPVRMSKFI